MTQLAGILNLTPDSFSGDGLSISHALMAVDAMIEGGAHIVDIGAESTRPGATPVSPEEEWARLVPLAVGLGDRLRRHAFSLDTRHAETARKALAAGFRIINDVSGAADEAMIAAVREYACRLIVMHSVSIPADPSQVLANGADPVREVMAWGKSKIAALEQKNIKRAQIIFDPGIGFGKTPQQSFELIKHIAQFKTLGTEIMVGHSRKSFLSLFTDKKAPERDPETLAVSWYLAGHGVDYLRVHDVKSHVAMLKIREAL